MSSYLSPFISAPLKDSPDTVERILQTLSDQFGDFADAVCKKPPEGSQQAEPMPGRYRLGNLYGRRFGDLGFQLVPHLRSVIRKDGRLVAGAGDGNIPESRIEQVEMHSGIGIDENPLGG